MSQDKEKAFENILKSDSRREFLKQMGVALGGVALTGGGAIGPLFGQTPLPSGYNFYRVWTGGLATINGIPNPSAAWAQRSCWDRSRLRESRRVT